MSRVMRSPSTLSLVFSLQFLERFIRQVALGSHVIFIQPDDDGLNMGTAGTVSLKLCLHVYCVLTALPQFSALGFAVFLLSDASTSGCLHVVL